MIITVEAREILESCESRLRALLARAAETGEYDSVIQITRLAKGITELAESTLGKDDVASQAAQVKPAGTESESNGKKPPKATPERSTTQQTRRKVSKTKKKDYPKFFRRGQDIIKVGWSKKDKREYQHKSPYRYLPVVASAIEDKSSNGSVISTQDVFPVDDPETGEEIPAYQAYLCLALLRDAGLIEQRGRQGHAIIGDQPLSTRSVVAWESLPKI